MVKASPENRWINTAESQNPALLAKAQHILENTIYGTLSTCSPDGLPWVSPVFLGYDTDWTLYWASAQVAQHSQNLYANQGRAAIAIYSTNREEGQGQGLYLVGTATEVEADAVLGVIPLLSRRAAHGQHRTPADYLDPSPRRIYCFRPQAVWMTGERIALSDTILMDTKIQLDLPRLIAATENSRRTP
jgi:putative heme iron utilization protein